MPGARDFFSLQSVQTDLGPAQYPVQWVPWSHMPKAKWPGHEADHLLPYRATEWVELYLHSPTCLDGMHKNSFALEYSDRFMFYPCRTFIMNVLSLVQVHVMVKDLTSQQDLFGFIQSVQHNFCIILWCRPLHLYRSLPSHYLLIILCYITPAVETGHSVTKEIMQSHCVLPSSISSMH